MVYTMHQINESPTLTVGFIRKFRIAQVSVIITLTMALLYIAFRYGKICVSEGAKLWRSMIFLVFSSVFIIALFIIIASNAFVPFYYSGSAIFVVYAFINVYVYYIQYMFTITKSEAAKMEEIERNGGVEEHHDVLSVGTMDLVDVNLDYEEKTKKDVGSRVELAEREEDGYVREEDSNVPVKNN